MVFSRPRWEGSENMADRQPRADANGRARGGQTERVNPDGGCGGGGHAGADTGRSVGCISADKVRGSGGAS